jgi:hypothetical protein
MYVYIAIVALALGFFVGFHVARYRASQDKIRLIQTNRRDRERAETRAYVNGYQDAREDREPVTTIDA